MTAAIAARRARSRARTSGSTPRPTSSRTAPSTATALIEAAMRDAGADWAGRDVLDLGCGTGFHLPRFAATAAHGVRRRAAPRPGCDWPRGVPARCRTSPCSPGTAQAVPLPDASVDVVHARWAYFFGPGCEPGLRELDRVVRRGGTAFVIDNDATPVDVRRLVPPGLPEGRPGGGRAVLVRARLDPHAARHRLALRRPRRPGGRRPHRVRPPRSPTRSWPSTTGTDGRLRRQPVVGGSF